MFAYHYRKITPEVKCKNQQNTIRRPVFLLYLTILHLKSPKNLPHGRFFRGTPERISPFGDKPRIRGAQQKNLPHGRFFGTPERISPLGDKPRICGAQQKNLPRGVSYEFQSKAGNLLGKTTYRAFLVINGVVGPVLLGGAVATFFTGSEFYINKGNIADTVMPVISSWANAGHGLDALLNPWNVVLGLAVLFLARILGALYFINNIGDADLVKRCRRALWGNTGLFLVFFLAFVIRTLLAEGYAVNPETGEVFMEPYKYLTNFIEMPVVLLVFLIGVLAVLWGIVRTVWKPSFDKGIWFAGAGTVLTVLALLLVAGYNNTAYYPSTADLQSSLTLANSCSSQFTLRVMAYVSVLVPFVLAYIFYAWRSIDRKKIDAEEMQDEKGHAY
mgnify:CR=1 FL=1